MARELNLHALSYYFEYLGHDVSYRDTAGPASAGGW